MNGQFTSLPESPFLSHETLAALRAAQERRNEQAAADKNCALSAAANPGQIAAMRSRMADGFYESPQYRQLQDKYRVTLTTQIIGHVYAEAFVPVEGIEAKNQDRVLINLHGGGFLVGARTISHLESIPISSVGRIRVISVDYGTAPEHTFPSASENVAFVYRELLKAYKPQNIGIYGCSAGGLLTAQALAWFQKERLPLPGAVAMLCGAAAYWTEGDSAYFMGEHSQDTAQKNPYFKGADADDPLAFPIRSSTILAKFPDSLLITSTRDVALSSVVHTHSRLVALGVRAELHVWEGLGHAFHFDPNLPESREVYESVVKFFDQKLGKSTSGSRP
jgi:epsilon-lactone hydrolase